MYGYFNLNSDHIPVLSLTRKGQTSFRDRHQYFTLHTSGIDEKCLHMEVEIRKSILTSLLTHSENNNGFALYFYMNISACILP